MVTDPTIHIEEIDGQFVATVPALGATVTGSTHDEALQNAVREIVARRIAEAQERKHHPHSKDHTA
jgi:predicted RNase H-like HicB family nuclease